MTTPKILLLLESARTCERDFLRGIARYAHLYGPWAFYRKPRFYIKAGSSSISREQIKDFDPDGIFVSDTEDLEAVLCLNKPTVIHTFKTNHYNAPVIIGDVTQTGQMGAEHLIGLGLRNFAYCGMGDYYWSTGRYESFRKTLAKIGFSTAYFELNMQKVRTSLTKEQQRLTNWVAGLPKPVGLMNCADDCSQYVIEACNTAMIEIPNDVAIISVDNDDMVCDLSDPPLTSIALDFVKAGFEAAELLDQLISKEKPRSTFITVHPSHIEVRASTDILMVEDPDVAAAVRFIRQNSNKLIQIEDVMAEVTCCQRMLHQKFMQTLGHSVHREIRNARVERIAKMLRETNKPVTQIALKLGYHSFNHISRYFKKAMGINPLAYRKRFTLK